MRILMLVTEYPPARGYGLARYASELSEALVEQGHEMHVVTCNYDEGRPSHVRGVHVHDMRERGPVRHFDWVGDAVLDNVRLLERGMEVAEENEAVNLLISHDWLAAHAAKALRSVLRRPWLLIMHDTERGKRGSRLSAQQTYISEMEQWAIGQADHVVTTSEAMRQELAEAYQTPAEKVSVVPCGVNAKRFESCTHVPLFRSLFAREDERLIVYAGRLSPMKGVEDLAEAFRLLLQRGTEAQLVLAGDGVLREPLEKSFEEAGLQGLVHFTGALGDKVLGALYQAADVVVMPSRYEPFGMVALEAAACGAPVIACNVGGLAKIIEHGDGAILGCPPGKPDDLASLMASVLSEPARARSLSAKAREHVIETYSWTRAAARVAAIPSALSDSSATSTKGGPSPQAAGEQHDALG